MDASDLWARFFTMATVKPMVDRNAMIMALVIVAALCVFYVPEPENIISAIVGIFGGALVQRN
jgi:hypothetical protein